VTTPQGYLAPYVTPAIVQQAPTGISWNTIPPGTQTTPQQKTAELFNICQRATAICDGYVNQILRCTTATEFLQGPDYYCTYQQSTGNMRLIMSEWPIIEILSVQVSPNTFPNSWTSLPSGYWRPETPVVNVYGSSAPTGSAQGGQSIIISSQAGGGWWLGRNGYIFQVEYLSGWPHTQLTSAVTAGATTIDVDDCTGWYITNPAGVLQGARGGIFDPGGAEEAAMITGSSASSGPGTLTLSAPLLYDHPQYTMVSTMPQTIQWGCVLAATSIALTRGATATAVHSIPGGQVAMAGKGPETLMQEAELLWHSYRRVL
jgi:hypothetical protein